MKKKMCVILFSFAIVSLSAYQDPLHEITRAEEFQSLYPDVISYETKENFEVTRFFLVRHGESEANILRIIDGGVFDMPLTQKGIIDAQKAGEFLATKIDRADLIISSPLKRAQQTAQGIKSVLYYNNELILDDRFIERSYGVFAGKLEIEYLQCKKIEKEAVALLPTFSEKFNFKEHESVESYKEVYDQMSDGLLELAKDHQGENLVIVTHSGSLRSLFLWEQLNNIMLMFIITILSSIMAL